MKGVALRKLKALFLIYLQGEDNEQIIVQAGILE